jgi:hypothetical protein
MPEQHEDEGNDEERPERREVALVAHQQPSEVPQPGEGPLHPPTLRVARTDIHRTPSPRTFPRTSFVGWDGRLDALRAQPPPEALAIVSFVSDQLFRSLPRPAPSSSGHPHRLERWYGQLHFVAISTRKLGTNRKPIGVRDEHNLGTLTPLGLADAGSPFLAGTKLPSKNALAHPILPCSSSAASKLRHTRSQVPSSCHALSLLQQVTGEPYSRGTSSQRHPVRST